jgi:hypothetical protein
MKERRFVPKHVYSIDDPIAASISCFISVMIRIKNIYPTKVIDSN